MKSRDRTLLVGAARQDSDPIGSVTKIVLRASARLDTRQPVLTTYLVYFTQVPAAQRARNAAGKAGWQATLSAVPGAYVLRLTRQRLLTDGQLDGEREQMLRLSATYNGQWRYVLLEEQGAIGTAWDSLERGIVAPADPASEVPAQRQASATELPGSRSGGIAG